MNTFRHHAVVCVWLAAAVAGPASADPQAAVRTAQAPAAAAAGDPSAAPQALSPDPLERLRQRIEERLNASRATPPGTTREPQTAHHAAAAAARAGSIANPAPRSRRGAAAAAEAQLGAAGAQARGAPRPESAPCARNLSQTPIDIPEGLAVDLEPVR